MSRKTYFIVMFTALFLLLALKPLAPAVYDPNNDVWSYAQNNAGTTLQEIKCVRLTPSSPYSCQVVTHSGYQVLGLGNTPQTALDEALNNLP